MGFQRADPAVGCGMKERTPAFGDQDLGPRNLGQVVRLLTAFNTESMYQQASFLTHQIRIVLHKIRPKLLIFLNFFIFVRTLT